MLYFDLLEMIHIDHVTLRTVWGFWHEHGIFTASGIGIGGVPLDKTPSKLDVAHWCTQAMYG